MESNALAHDDIHSAACHMAEQNFTYIYDKMSNW